MDGLGVINNDIKSYDCLFYCDGLSAVLDKKIKNIILNVIFVIIFIGIMIGMFYVHVWWQNLPMNNKFSVGDLETRIIALEKIHNINNEEEKE